MKKWQSSIYFAVALLATSFISYGQSSLRDSVNFDNGNFKIVYSEVLEGPRSIRYTVKCPNGSASRKGMDFYKDKNIHTSDNEDYVANEWDKGHMAPAASFNCNTEMLRGTFTYINSSLQQQSLNRGVWKKLEVRERELAQNSTVQVFIRAEYGTTPERVPTNAAVPVGYYKELKVGNMRECYYFKNVKPETSELDSYKCPCRNVIQ